MRCALLVAVLAGRAVAQPADWAPQRDAFDPQVIARYRQQLARDPFDDATLARLARLYTGRHTADELEQSLGEEPAALVVRARLHQQRKDRAGATAFYLRALERDPAGPLAARAWFALAQLDRDRGDPDAARAAYVQVLATSPPAPLARTALHQLAALAAVMRDPRTDGYFVQLLALAPDDPDVWLERGDALVAQEPALAAESFARAEQLVTDPQRRLDVITRRGDALAKAARPDAAIAEYRRAIALAPKGNFLVGELLGRMVDVARAHHTLTGLAGELEAAWPERSRGYLEWSTLAAIYLEVRTPDEAVTAYEHAARLAPWELATQRTLIGLLAKQGRDPRAQLRAAIRAAPSEPTLQLDLAKRTWPDPAALDLLDQTARQFSRDASVLDAVARQFLDFERPARAEKWLEALARLEPDDDDHWLALANAYLAADNHRGAIDAWNRVAREQPGAKLRFANVLLDEQDNHSALRLIDEAIALDVVDPEAWRLRAIADEQLGDLRTAIEDALHEVRLTRPDRAALRHARHHVVQLVLRTRPDPEAWNENDDDDTGTDLWTQYSTQWHDAFWAEKPDLDAGYYVVELIVEHSCRLSDLRLSCADAREATERLAKLVPDDPDVLRTLIKIFEDQGLHQAAASRLERLLALESITARPAIERHLALERLAVDESTYRLGLEHDEDTTVDDGPDAPRAWGAGLAIAYGATLRGDTGGSIGLGGYLRRTFDEPSLVAASNAVEARVDYTQTHGANGLGGGLGLWHTFEPVLIAASLSAGIEQRLEIRTGEATTMASAAGLIFGLHEAPLELGLRIEQQYVGGLDTRGLLEIRVRLF